MKENLAIFSSIDIKDLVQDLQELLSQNNVSFLLGAGCSYKAGLPLMPQLTDEVLGHDVLSKKTKKILHSIRELFLGAKNATIEDYMSELVDFLSIAQRRIQRGASKSEVSIGDSDHTSEELKDSLNEIKKAIVSIVSKKEVDISHHRRFVRAVHSSLQAGKPRRMVDYIILNYDTLFEDALGLEKINHVDGFAGAATGWWEPLIFQNNEIEARVYKVHGSIDWCLLEGDTLPRRVRKGINPDTSLEHVLIYPAATKYQESQRDPFAQLLNQVRNGLLPTEGNEKILAICGYNFGDEHINIEIENALVQSKGRLTVAIFNKNDVPSGITKKWIDNSAIADQIRIYSNKGYFHLSTRMKLDEILPWWKFEVLGRLLGGER